MKFSSISSPKKLKSSDQGLECGSAHWLQPLHVAGLTIKYNSVVSNCFM